MFDTSPTLYTPVAGDNGPGLRALLNAGKRWIQINGVVCPLQTRVDLLDDGVPADYLLIEPAPGIDKVTIDVSGIGRDPTVPTNPSYSGFEYNGQSKPAGYLTASAAANDRTVTVNDGSLYTVGSWIFLSDASKNPSVYLLPLDGPMERRRVVAIDGNVLVLEQPLRRAHDLNVIAALCTPILFPTFRDLVFTGNAAGGIHIHCATKASISRIASTAWRGRFLVLLDNGGIDNSAEDVFCTGSEPGAGATQNAWGFAAEGQEDSLFTRCGGTRCGNGFLLNYTVDTVGMEPVAYSNNANAIIDFQSTRTILIRPSTTAAIGLDTYISPDSVDCQIIGRTEYVAPIVSGSEYLDPRDLPIDGLRGTDRVLAIDENGGGKQVLPDRFVLRALDGAITAEGLEVKSGIPQGGSFRVTNNNRSWLFGMLSTAGAKDLVFFDLTAGAVRLTISGTTGEFDVPGTMILRKNLAFEAAGAIYVGGKKVLGAQRTGWTADTGTSKRTTSVTYAPGAQLVFGAAYAQADMTALATRLVAVEAALRDATQGQKALKDDLLVQGLIGS